MAGDLFLDEDHRVLTSEAFDFVLSNELKRAVRSQNFLTLVSIRPSTSGVRSGNAAAGIAISEIARLISCEVRETDLLAEAEGGRLWLALLDADLQSSFGVVDRLWTRLEAHGFPRPVTLHIGAATCPTHGGDAESLRRAADAQPVQRPS
jgi:GGDEF domain-containing protein